MRLPLLPTLMVAVMLPVMIGLGFWQLQRAQWKADLLVRLEAQAKLPVLETSVISDDLEFRRIRVSVDCPDPSAKGRSGKNAAGQVGFSMLLLCNSGGQPIFVDSGWSDRPDGWTKLVAPWPPEGAFAVTGTLVRTGGNKGPRYTLVSEAAPAPLVTSAPPSPADIPNNHMAYAVQWFAFAATLGIIYAVFVQRLRRK
ncbi:SURF1 family protein [Sphingosinicella soli]|uniref:SURF1-like protein n=1 Tax=Sphingosinicella soli TaxID=333708 RepID=A0A7W7B5V5_9SPHN|nr:SURF1 family protein [Sphingosinicella soli]MBB4633467.1 surfeit locus 1 family protein [Sphingosinicella soli]